MEKKLHLASAVSQNGGYSRPNMSNKALITAKMGQILPVWHYACVPGDKVTVRHNQFARFEPLAVPSYVDLTYRTLTVFVPYHQVMDGAESFFANQARFKGVYNVLPVIQNAAFRELFLDTDISTNTGVTSASFDFHDANQYYKFTPLGRYISKVLLLLGYGWTGGDTTSGHVLTFPSSSNALPLLSFAHAYNSYLSYSARYNTSSLSSVLETIKRRNTSTNYISKSDLKTILTSILLTYEESFFSSLWKYPYSSMSQSSAGDFKTSDLASSHIVTAQDGDISFLETVGAEFIDMNAAQVRLAMKFDDYFRRTSYGGSKDVQQIYSRFGVKIDDYRTRYPYYIGESAQQVRIGDVTSTSDTSNAVIGAYAGKAISDGSQSFDFTSNDYGMLFTFGWFAPRPTYYTGVDPEILRLSVFDFYTPELDKGFAAFIPAELLNIQTYGRIGQTGGYGPVYCDYLYPKDYIVGDFNRFVGNEAWHFGRKPSDLGDATAQSDKLIYMPCTGTEFERIFNIIDTEEVDVDTIYMDVRNEVHATRPMRDRSGKADLGEGSIDLPNMGSQVN